MHKLICCLGVVLLTANIAVADDLPAVTLEAPKEWRPERIDLPPGFAPDMKAKGYETIRFAPGMFRADSDSFFSYVIVFVLAGDPPDKETLERELLTYYRGLAKAVGSGRGLTIDTDAFTLELKQPDGAGNDDDRDDETTKTWIGTLNWVEPFVTGDAQELRIEIGAGPIEGHMASHVTMCISPQPADAAIWETMHGVRDSVKFAAGE
jgi:hypothetical protein